MDDSERSYGYSKDIYHGSRGAGGHYDGPTGNPERSYENDPKVGAFPAAVRGSVETIARSAEGRRDGLKRLVAGVRAKDVQGVVVRSLSHLARSLRHLTDLGRLFGAQDVALIAIEDLIDTTDPGGAIRWRDWLEISGRLDRQLRAEAATLAHLRTPVGRWGRSAAVMKPI
ncbi:MAG TPA: recombinase family protein [Thermoanaerobaculia bacterium]|nr:recombinase family protein [Thermoanaerobaculia bacterium]